MADFNRTYRYILIVCFKMMVGIIRLIKSNFLFVQLRNMLGDDPKNKISKTSINIPFI